jgi:CBS-domain-containing membrane protein
MRYLPSIRTDMHYKLKAEDVMEKELVVIPLTMTYGRLLSTLKEKRFQAYPVITPDQEFLGIVSDSLAHRIDRVIHVPESHDRDTQKRETHDRPI